MAFNELSFGAQLAAAGKMLGMSPDETIAHVERKLEINNQKRARRGEAPIDGRQGINAFLQRMGRLEEFNAEYPEYLDDKRTVANSVLDAEDRSEAQQFGGIDNQGNIKDVDQQIKERERAAGKKDPNEITRYYYDPVSKQQKSETIYLADGMPMPDRFKPAAKARDFGLYREDVAAPAQQVMAQELARLQAGIDQYGSDAFGSVPAPQRGVLPDAQGGGVYTPEDVTVASAAGRLEDQLRTNTDAERSLVREMVRRDNENVNPRARIINDLLASMDAQEIAADRFTAGGGGAQADAVLAKIGVIADLGKAGRTDQIRVGVPVPTRQLDPTAIMMGRNEALNAPIEGSTDDTPRPTLSRSDQWLVDHAPGYREGKVFGDYPQVPIAAQLRAAEQAIQGIKIRQQGQKKPVPLFEPGSIQINNLEDLQVAANRAVALGQAKGMKFYDRVDGSNVYNADPGIEQVLNKARYNENQQDSLARALFQVEAGRRQSANRAAKEANVAGIPGPGVKVTGGAQHKLLGEGQVGVSRINREKIEGKEVKSQLQALTGRAGNPGEPLDRQELRLARMPDQAAPAGQKPPRASYIKGDVRGLTRAERVARMGSEFAAQASGVEDRYLAAERKRRAEAPIPNERGRLVRENPNFGIGRNEVELVQGATSAAVNPAPQPAENLAGAGSGNGGRRPTTMGYMGTPDGPNDQPRRERFIDSIVGGIRNAPRNFRRARPAYQAAAATGGALLGAVGLDALVTDETERRGRREEQYA